MEDFTQVDRRLSGFTYIMSNQIGLIKVGQSMNPEDRRRVLESSSGLAVNIELVVRGSFKEKITHRLLKEHNTVGEWFSCSVDIAIEALKSIEYLNNEAIYDQMLNYTKAELDKVLKERLKELIKYSGSYVYLSKMLSIPISTVQGWVIRGRISKGGAILVEKHKDLAKNFSSKYLRPDL